MSWSYRERIAGQSVAAALDAALCTALIEAWIWYGPGWLRRTSSRTIAWPSAISPRFQQCTVLIRKADQLTVHSGAGRAPGIDQQHQGQ